MHIAFCGSFIYLESECPISMWPVNIYIAASLSTWLLRVRQHLEVNMMTNLIILRHDYRYNTSQYGVNSIFDVLSYERNVREEACCSISSENLGTETLGEEDERTIR